MKECKHDFTPVLLDTHPNNPNLKVVWVVCKICYAHRPYFSKRLK